MLTLKVITYVNYIVMGLLVSHALHPRIGISWPNCFLLLMILSPHFKLDVDKT